MPRESRREKLKQAKKEQEELERECKNLEQGDDPKQSCKDIINFIEEKGTDGFSMEARETNPFAQRPSCFIKGTKILVNKETMKTKNIENIEIGDNIVSIIVSNTNKNKNNNNISQKHNLSWSNGTVYHKLHSKEFVTCEIVLSNNTRIECTLEHPFYVENQG